jgi:hypothetical protein
MTIDTFTMAFAIIASALVFSISFLGLTTNSSTCKAILKENGNSLSYIQADYYEKNCKK